MLNARSSAWLHAMQNILLIFLSLGCLPTSLAILAVSQVAGIPARRNVAHQRRQCMQRPDFRSRTVLVTGVSMSKGLTLARLFYKAGHRVIGADFDANSCGSKSSAVDKFYLLKASTTELGSAPYLQSLLDVILIENVDLWVSCSGVASAIEDGEAKEIIERHTSCRAIQFDVEITRTLHEKGTFIEYARSIGLNVPETHTVFSCEDAERILFTTSSERKFIMKPIGMDDTARGDMTLLPRANTEETSQHLRRMRISAERPYILQQFIKGSEYCTHALITSGEVKAFVACPSSELLMHYTALPADSPLSRAMLLFTSQFARLSGPEFTGHLSFDFLIENITPSDPRNILLFPIECNPRAHTAVVLLGQTMSMVDAYLSVLIKDHRSGSAVIPSTPVGRPSMYFWIGHDLVTLMLWSPNIFSTLPTLFSRILRWQEGAFEWSDPMPWFWMYHVYWPSRFFQCLWEGKKWSRINVSTGKIFEC